MKKYFMKETQEELKFGDMIELDFSNDNGEKTVHHHMECKFIPELVDTLLENDIIEEKEIKEKPETIDFNVEDEEDTVIDELIQSQIEIKNLLTSMFGCLTELNKLVKELGKKEEKPVNSTRGRKSAK